MTSLNPDSEKPSPDSAEYHKNDVLCGRGGSINSHPGNERFRQLVEKRKRVYLTARFKREKRLIASSIVSEIRSLDPPGRFLARDGATGKWVDIGDEKARDKTSQALRENAPSIRAEIETEIHQQREEMRREEIEANRASVPMVAPSQPPPYYQQWGYYGPFYGGYGPPPDAQQQQYAPVAPYAGQAAPWPSAAGPYAQATAPTNEGPSYNRTEPVSHHQRPAPKPSKRPSTVPMAHSEDSKGSTTAFDFVSAVPSSIVTWTRNSFSFGASSMDQQDDLASTSSGRRVSFQGGQHHGGQHRGGHHHAQHSRPHYHSTERPQKRTHSAASVTPETKQDRLAQPEPADANTLLSQVANHILTSWDSSAISCAQPDHVLDHTINTTIEPTEVSMEEVGQEVELVDNAAMEYDMEEDDDDIREDRNPMPPPENRADMDWPSKVGSCHTWFSEAPSFFSTTRNPLSPSASLEMDQSHAASALYSCGGSIGGESLFQAFHQDALEAAPSQPAANQNFLPSPQHSMNHRVLNQIPSWERSFRSQSPSTVASESSFVSKRSDVASPRVASPRASLSPRNSMEWDQPKIRE